MSLEEALEKALAAKNNEINGRLGFSAHQLVFGQGAAIIGITDGDLATDESITQSEAVDKHFKTKLEAQEIFRKNDADLRMKKILKNKVTAYNDETYEEGEKILFQDEQNLWKGPATVTGQDGRIVSFIWQGKRGKSTHICRTQRWVEQNVESDDPKDNTIDAPEAESKADNSNNAPEVESEAGNTNDAHETESKADKESNEYEDSYDNVIDTEEAVLSEDPTDQKKNP